MHGFMGIYSETQAQCNTDQFTEKGIRKLEQGYTFLKSYPVSGEQGKKYSYIFSQGTSYLITLANNNSDSQGIYITLIDSNNKEIATSYTNGKFYSAVSFTCKTTGIYHLKFSFQDSKDYCAAGVLAMKR
jgi:hypothetical protein